MWKWQSVFLVSQFNNWTSKVVQKNYLFDHILADMKRIPAYLEAGSGGLHGV